MSMNEYLLKRIKSFAWRAGGVLVVSFIAMVLEPEVVNALGLSELVIAMLGLVAGEVTKWLNTGVK
jgi:hypothetical protein